MAYPRLLNLDPDTAEQLRQFIKDEITNHLAERSSWLKRIEDNNILYRCKPESSAIPGLSNIVVPLAQIGISALHAAEMTTLFALDQFCTVQLSNEWADIDKSLETILDKELLKTAGIYKTIDTAILEKKIHGIGIAKTGWREDLRKIVREIDGKEQEFTVAIHRGPVTDPIVIQNFVMPFVSQDVQQAQWCGEIYHHTPYQFRLLIESEFLPRSAYEKIESWVYTRGELQNDTVVAQQERSENRVPLWPQQIEWYELKLSWDIDKDGKYEEIVVYYHHDSVTILGARYNTNSDLRRGYRTVRHFPVPHRWLGIGIVEQVEQMQIEVTTIHRQRIDTGNFANLRMFKARRLSGIDPDAIAFPGKIWYVDNMDDLESFQMGEIYNSAYQNETQVVLYAQQLIGVNELTLGMPQVGTPGTASSDLARVQEGKKRFDYVYQDVKRFAVDLAMDVVCNIAEHGISSVELYRNVPNGDRVEQFLNLPVDLLRKQIVFDLKIAGQHQNKVLDRATWQQLAGILTQYWTNMITLSQQAGDPKVTQQFVQRAMYAGTEAMKQILESFDTRNIDRMLAQVINESTPNPQLTSGSQIQSPQLIQLPGMGFVNPLITTVGG